MNDGRLWVHVHCFYPIVAFKRQQTHTIASRIFSVSVSPHNIGKFRRTSNINQHIEHGRLVFTWACNIHLPPGEEVLTFCPHPRFCSTSCYQNPHTRSFCALQFATGPHTNNSLSVTDIFSHLSRISSYARLHSTGGPSHNKKIYWFLSSYSSLVISTSFFSDCCIKF